MHTRLSLLWICLLLQLGACSGGGLLDLAEGGIDGTGLGLISEGSISGFGSIIVNDAHYSTEQAEVYLNGEADGAEQLKLGMHVIVETAQDQSQAQRISYHDLLRGPLEFVAPSALRLLGHVVQITPDTRLYGVRTLSELQAGDTVRISGPATAPEEGIAATLVERVSAGDIRISGMVSNLDEANYTFFLAGMRIDYSAAQTLPAQLDIGLPVEVIGLLDADSHSLHARHIQSLQPEVLSAGKAAVIYGSVTRFNGPQDFEVQYRPVRLGPDLTPDSAAGLKLGAQVKIRGVTDAQGVIDITELSVVQKTSPFSGDPNLQLFRVSGPVSGIAADTLEVFGVAAHFDERSLFRDLSGQYPDYGVADVRGGDYFTAAGILDEVGALFAVMLNYEPFVPSAQRQLQGLATNLDAGKHSLSILGVPILSDAQTRYYDASAVEFRLPPPGAPLTPPVDTETDADAFFVHLSAEPQWLVYAVGSVAGEGMIAEMLVVLGMRI